MKMTTGHSLRFRSKTPAPKPTQELESPAGSPPVSSSSDEFRLGDDALELARAGGWGEVFTDSSPSEPPSPGGRLSQSYGGWDGAFLSSPDEGDGSETRSPGEPPVAPPPDSPNEESESE